MTDRELLELAAKAAGKVLIRSRLDDPMNRDFLVANSDRNDHHESGPWSPLTDDGDSLRLAVKLGLSIDRDFDRIDVYRQRDLLACEYLYQLPEPTDPSAATRRAIVRAAAEIGKAM